MSEEQPRVRILIADDHSLFRDGLRRLLESEPDLEVVGEAPNGETALRLIEELQPDLLLLDVAMAGMPGLEVLSRLAEKSFRPRTILVTAAIHPSQMARAVELGAHGIVMKESATRVLFDSIKCVMGGGFWICEAPTANAQAAVRGLFASVSSAKTSLAGDLTDRELEIAMAIVGGLTNREIATKFSISERTVKNHLTHIFDKVGVSSRLELGLFAVDRRPSPTSEP